jgi:hypothetical protein
VTDRLGRRLKGIPLLLLVCTLSCASQESRFKTENVVLVIIDGLRYTEGLGDPKRANTPEMDRLSAVGTIIEPFVNGGTADTQAAVPAVWCGAWTAVHTFADPDCGGDENLTSELPTVFEYYRKGLRRPPEDCIYVLQDFGCLWKGSFDEDYGPSYWPTYRPAGSSDTDVWNAAREALDRDRPGFLLVYLSDTDAAGNEGDWDEYLETIRTADGIVGQLWDHLQSTRRYAGTTTLLVTNDHGRHTHDPSGHGCGCAGCQRIQLLAVGPDVKAGHVSRKRRELIDIAPTIGLLLGFATGKAEGSAMVEILQASSR